jgi:hypothetical protein
MEILDLKFAGIPVWIIIVAVGIWYNGRYAYREWRKDREMAREVDEASRALHEKYRWEPDMRTGSDQGKWVRRDGLPDYD